MSKSNTRVIVILNEKGGCCKTTTTIQIIAGLAKKYKVLLIDLDQKASSTKHITGNASHKKGIYDLFLSEGALSLNKICVKPKGKWGNLLVAPADRRMAKLGAALIEHEILDCDRILQKAVEQTNNFFDFIVIDTSGDLMVTDTKNAMIAATEYLIVTDTSTYSVDSVKVTLAFGEKIKKTYNHKLRYLGTLLGGFKKPHLADKQDTLAALEKIPGFLSDYIIPDDAKVDVAQKANKPLEQVAKQSPAAKKYRQLTKYIEAN